MRTYGLAALACLLACGDSASKQARERPIIHDERAPLPKPQQPPSKPDESVVPPLPEPVTVESQPSYLLDRSLRLNEIQMKGSHNSYHLWIENGEPQWAYDTPPISVQLEYQGVRALELDVHYVGGRFGVYQLDGWEDRSTCPWLEDCLRQVREWLQTHPGHAPIILYFEPRDTAQAPFYEVIEAFEQVLATAWPREKIYTPDDLMGNQYADVTSALRAKGWPTLGDVRGKVLMVLHDFGAVRYRYLRDRGLQGRRMFVSDVRMDHPQAGFLALDEPVENLDTIKDFVARGYMVRTRADDLPTQGGDRVVKRDAALRSGAQVILTDYPEGYYIPGYYVEMPGGKPVRCNPITAPRAPGACTAEGIEDPLLLRVWNG